MFALADRNAASPGNVVSVFSAGLAPFDTRYGMIEAVFSSLQRAVSIDAALVRVAEGFGTPTNAPRLEAYDSAGGLLGAIDWTFGQATSVYHTLAFSSLTDSIARIRFFSSDPGGGSSNLGLFDNLVFTTGGGGGGGGGTVPEPGTLGLMTAALLAGVVLRRRQQQ